MDLDFLDLFLDLDLDLKGSASLPSFFIILCNSLQKEDSPLIEGLKIFWNEKEIDLIYGLLNHIDDKKDLEKNVYLKNIEDIITFKEKEVYDYIYKKSTTYT